MKYSSCLIVGMLPVGTMLIALSTITFYFNIESMSYLAFKFMRFSETSSSSFSFHIHIKMNQNHAEAARREIKENIVEGKRINLF